MTESTPYSVVYGDGEEHMPTERDYIKAAKKPPSERSATEQMLVEQGSNLQSVRNADFAAHKAEKNNVRGLFG